MALNIGELNAQLTMDSSDYTRGLKDAEKMTGRFEQSMNFARNAAEKFAITLAGVAVAMTPISIHAIKMSSDLQQAKISMETMLGSAQKADKMIGDLWDFAAKTPFEFSDLQMATKRMLAFGFEADAVLPTLKAVGDAAAGLGLSGQEGIGRILLALGQMKAKSKVSGDEMLQLTEVGVPAWDILAKSIGKSTAEVMKLAEKGVIPADLAIQALVAGMSERFPGMMDKQSKSLAGLFSTLKDNVNMALVEVFKPAVEWLTNVGLPKLIDMTSRFTQSLREGKGLGEAFKSMFPADMMDVAIQSLGKFGDAIAWVKDNSSIIIPLLIQLTTAFAAFEIIKSVINPLTTFVAIGATVVGVLGAMATAMGNVAAAAAITGIFEALIGVLAGLSAVTLGIGAVVLVVGALAAAAYLVYNNWEKVSTWFVETWNSLVNFVADNINILIALFPTLGLAAYVIYEYWNEAITLANKLMEWLANEVAWAKGVIINEFTYYQKMWDDFVAWAAKGINDFKTLLSDLAISFMPAWASSMFGEVALLGQKLAAKTAEIGNAMRRNLTISLSTKAAETTGIPPEIPDLLDPEVIDDMVNRGPKIPKGGVDWSGVDFSGGGGGAASGGGAGSAASKYENQLEKMEQLVANLNSKILGETGTTFEKSMARLDSEVLKMSGDIKDAMAAGVDVKDAQDALNKYRDAVTANVEKTWREAWQNLRDQSGLTHAQLVGDAQAEADAELQITMTRLKKEYDEKLKAVQRDKDDADAKLAIDQWLKDQQDLAEKQHMDKHRQNQLQIYQWQVQLNNNLLALHQQTAAQTDAANLAVYDSQITYLQGQLAEIEKYGGQFTEQWYKIMNDIATITQQQNDIMAKNLSTSWDLAMEEIQNQQFNYKDLMVNTWNDISNAVSGHFRDMITGAESMGQGIKGIIRDLTTAILEMFAEIMVQQFIMQPIRNWFTGLLGGVGGGGSLIGGNYGNGRNAFANGGIASGWSLVGEKGPELVNFTNPGRVYPADETEKMLNGGRNQQPVIAQIHVHGVRDANSFMQSQGQIGAAAARSINRAMRRNL